MDKIIKDALQKEISLHNTNGNSVLIIKDGQEIYYADCGYADAENKKPFKRDTIIRMYSMSKPITAVATMVAVEKGLIKLDDLVCKYLPEYENMNIISEDGSIRKANTKLTLMNLVTMTSGIPYGENWEGCSQAGRKMQVLFDDILAGMKKGEHKSTREIARLIATIPTAFEPGERWMYGLSADIMGAVIEVASGMKYGEFLKRYIFEPLDMVDTGFFVPTSKRDRFAMDYEWYGDDHILHPNDESHLGEYYYEDGAFESGGAGLVSTIDDYAHFAVMLANEGEYNGKRIISKESVKLIATNYLTESQMDAFSWESNIGYGYGVLVRVQTDTERSGNKSGLGEFGWDGWTGNYFCVDPVNKVVFLYFMQRRGAYGIEAIKTIKNAIYES